MAVVCRVAANKLRYSTVEGSKPTAFYVKTVTINEKSALKSGEG